MQQLSRAPQTIIRPSTPVDEKMANNEHKRGAALKETDSSRRTSQRAVEAGNRWPKASAGISQASASSAASIQTPNKSSTKQRSNGTQQQQRRRRLRGGAHDSAKHAKESRSRRASDDRDEGGGSTNSVALPTSTESGSREKTTSSQKAAAKGSAFDGGNSVEEEGPGFDVITFEQLELSRSCDGRRCFEDLTPDVGADAISRYHPESSTLRATASRRGDDVDVDPGPVRAESERRKRSDRSSRPRPSGGNGDLPPLDAILEADAETTISRHDNNPQSTRSAGNEGGEPSHRESERQRRRSDEKASLVLDYDRDRRKPSSGGCDPPPDVIVEATERPTMRPLLGYDPKSYRVRYNTVNTSSLVSKQSENGDKSSLGHDDDDDDDASQASANTFSSVFTNTCIKLKGFVKKPSSARRSKNGHGDKHWKLPISSIGVAEKINNHRVSTTKSSIKYRSKRSAGSSTVATAAATSVGNGSGRSPGESLSGGSSDDFQFPGRIARIEETEPYRGDDSGGRPSAIPSLPSHVEEKSTTAKASPPISKNANDQGGRATRVCDLPWKDPSSEGKLHGDYSGPVDGLLRPHGEGSLVFAGNDFLRFYGRWAGGELTSPLMNEDEWRDRGGPLLRSGAKKKDPPPGGGGGGGRGRNPRREYYQGKPCVSKGGGEKESSSRECERRSETIPSGRQSKQKYGLGDVARTPRDMVIFKSKREASNSVSLLRQYDQAFLKRSNGLWTCAVLAERGLQPTLADVSSRWFAKHEIDPETTELEERMLFVTNENGATKVIKKRHWAKFVRRMREGHDGNRE